MKKLLQKGLYEVLLGLFTIYVLMDAFVIPHAYQQVVAQDNTAAVATATTTTEEAVSSASTTDTSTTTETTTASTVEITSDSYVGNGITIQLTETREYSTEIYIADVVVSDISQLQTFFAQNTYGRNITATTSTIASENNVILAINGDFYGTRSGYVIRNGVLYRESANSSSQEDLVIWSDGSFGFVTEGSVTAQELLDEGAWQVLSFGPCLIENGTISVTTSSEVGQAKTSNPRTAIGTYVDDSGTRHYVFVVADGRTSASAGLTLYELAEVMQEYGVTDAYNLDGGGSSTMVFNGEVINQPTSNGKTITERKVSDIVGITA